MCMMYYTYRYTYSQETKIVPPKTDRRIGHLEMMFGKKVIFMTS